MALFAETIFFFFKIPLWFANPRWRWRLCSFYWIISNVANYSAFSQSQRCWLSRRQIKKCRRLRTSVMVGGRQKQNRTYCVNRTEHTKNQLRNECLVVVQSNRSSEDRQLNEWTIGCCLVTAEFNWIPLSAILRAQSAISTRSRVNYSVRLFGQIKNPTTWLQSKAWLAIRLLLY